MLTTPIERRPATGEVIANRCGNAGGHGAPRVVLLSSSLLTDRMFLYSSFSEALARSDAVAEIWASSVEDCPAAWSHCDTKVVPFPPVRAYKEFPHNLLRRGNDYAWDFILRSPSRLSMIAHVRSKRPTALDQAGHLLGRAIATVRAQRMVEDRLERLLLRYPRCPEAAALLAEAQADVLVTTNPFWFTEPAVAAVAKRQGLRTLAMIPSWDNVTTKPRMVFKYDGYLVWSETTRDELRQYYPAARDVPIYVVGAPQFDVFFNDRFQLTRAEFLHSIGLAPNLPVVVYALGSPNFLQEAHGAVEFARRMARGELGDLQMIVRPHPIHNNAEMAGLFAEFGPRVVLQRTSAAGLPVVRRSQGEHEIREWINTFRHADVVVNLSSTVTVDAAIFDRPVVNLDFDPEPGHPNQALVKDVNHVWCHFKPIAESGGVWLAKDMEHLVEGVKTYLAMPELHHAGRQWIVKHVCGYADGRCGARMAEAIFDFADRRPTGGDA